MRISLLLTLVIFVAACAPVESGSSPAINATPTATPTASATPDAVITEALKKIEAASGGKVGVYAEVYGDESRSAGLNESDSFAMQSVVKLPISMAVLKRVQAGELTLDSNIEFTNDELVPAGMHSPIREKFPEGGKMTVNEMIRWAMSESDGTAADVLQRVAGGAKGVQAYLDNLGVDGMQVVYSHTEFFRDDQRQYANAVTPRGAVQLLKVLVDASTTDNIAAGESPITKEHALYLLEIMRGTPTGPKRLKGLLPPGTDVAHKTGSSGTRDGITAATNDAGIIPLPDGRMILIAVFVGDSKGDTETRERAIAESAKLFWDRWAVPKK